MTSFYSESELKQIGFKYVGMDVHISKYAHFYDEHSISIGNHVRIDDFCILSGKIELRNNIHIAAYSALYGGEEGIYIDDFANISSRVTIYSVSDDYSGMTMSNPTIPNKYKAVESAPVHIGRHTIIGATSVVMPGVNIEEGSSFGAFSFINRDSESWSVNIGIPFKKIKDRKRDLLELEKKYSREENNLLNHD